jgi:hypothetical protein
LAASVACASLFDGPAFDGDAFDGEAPHHRRREHLLKPATPGYDGLKTPIDVPTGQSHLRATSDREKLRRQR